MTSLRVGLPPQAADVFRITMNQQEPEFARQSRLIVGKRRRWMATGALFVIFVALATVSWEFWDNRNESQINKVLSQSPMLVKLAATDVEGLRKVAAWLRALVISGKSYAALKTALGSENAYCSSYAMASIIEALAITGKTGEAQQVAGEALKTARRIADAYARSQVMGRIVEALAKGGKTDEALEVAHSVEESIYRCRAMVCVVEALAKAGKTDEAQLVAGGALETARLIPDADSRSRAMANIVEALAKAGKADEA